MASPVLVITNAYPDFEGSSHGIFVRRLAEDISAHGWLSHVLAPRVYSRSLRAESHPTHTVTRFRFPSEEKLLIEYQKTPFLRIAALLGSGLAAATRLIRKENCRLVHAHWAFPAGVIALAASRLTGRPMALTVHGSDWRLAQTRGGITMALFRRVAKGADRIISVSEEITAGIEIVGVEKNKITTCPMGADERVFHSRVKPDPAMKKTFRVVSTRNLLPIYRVADLIEAAALAMDKIPGLAVTIAGEGPESHSLQERAARLGLSGKADFTGCLEPERLAVLLASSSVYVSTSPAEGSSVSLLEAMACGSLPVVTDIPANREWIKDGNNGLLFPAGDIEALAEALVKAHQDKKLLDSAAVENPVLVEERGAWSRQVETTEQCYRNVAGD
ncbi:MAG: glycosyltransferase [Gemmatimonadota bacterium]|nr:glycosyltransferase [Gemmatimonadota bacterium]